jgi:hypothetical protein
MGHGALTFSNAHDANGLGNRRAEFGAPNHGSPAGNPAPGSVLEDVNDCDAAFLRGDWISFVKASEKVWKACCPTKAEV